MKRTILLVVLSILAIHLTAQKEWSNWYYSGHSLLTFKNGGPEYLTDFIPYTGSGIFNFENLGSGGISYSDPATGEMQFIVSNRLVFNRNFTLVPNDYFLRSCPDKYSYHILPFHDNSKRFYIIQFQDCSADVLQQENPGLQVRCPNAIGLGYSILDLNLDNGLGDLTVVNQPIIGGLTGQMTTVRHANGKDEWIIVHSYNSNSFLAFLATDGGIQPAVSTQIGPVITGGFAKMGGTLTASHDGKLLAGGATLADGMQLFDFDNATGVLSNYRTIPISGSISHLQFSPDNSKIYYNNYEHIYQFDLNQSDIAGSLTQIFEQKNGLIYDMQLAPDGKIYVTKLFFLSNEDGSYAEYVGAIQCPNLPQYACNFNPKVIPTPRVSFPDLINDFVKEPRAPLMTKLDLGKDTAICFGEYTITAPDGWESYRWNTGETTKSITVKQAGTYHVLTGNTGFSCPSAYGYIKIEDQALKLDLGEDTLICKGTPYTIHIPVDYTDVLWENGSHTYDSSIVVSNQYIVSALDKKGCFTKDTVNVNFKYFPIADFGNDTTLCDNDSLTLVMQPQSNPFFSGVYQWQDSSTKDHYTITEPGTYWGNVTFQGCTVSDTIKVSYLTADHFSLGSDTALCMGDSLGLHCEIGNAVYLWNTGETADSIVVRSTGTYFLNVSTASCKLSDTVTVVFHERPVFTLGNDTAVCERSQITLKPDHFFEKYLWQDGSDSQEFQVDHAGWYWMKATENNCSTTDSIYIAFNPLPQIDLGKDTGICRGSTLLLDVQNPDFVFYQWQDNSIAQTFLVSESGDYSVHVIDRNGCKNGDSIQIAVLDKPSFTLGADTVLCETQSLVYHFDLLNASYTWSDGSSGKSFMITSPGSYSLTVDQSGCTSSDTINVLFKPMPVVNLGSDTTVCVNAGIILNAFNPGAEYLWQDGNRTQDYAVSKTGTYYAKVNLNGCEKSDTILVRMIDKPRFSLGNDTMICKGYPLVLKAGIGGNNIYLWQDGTSRDEFLVTDEGAYSVRVTNQCGSMVDEIKITTFICTIQMPNAFTPNHDGLNDIFRVKYPFPANAFAMSVYNRWGQKIFETTTMENGWDGTWNGEPQPAGTYQWKISMTDASQNTQHWSGVVMLMR